MTIKPPRLSIHVLGTPEIQVSGRPLSLNHHKARAVLFYLAATGEPHTRDHLANLLWGESGQSEAYHSLRSSLYYLRKALRVGQVEDSLISNGDLLNLDPASYDCDLTEFYRSLAQGDERGLSQAVALYRGSLLQGFSILDAPGFDDWVQVESTRLDRSCLEALHRLTAWAESSEDWSTALSFARQMVQIDPLTEEAQQRLMRLYLRQDEAGLALRQYRQFENQLQQELGIGPSPETKALYDDILRQHRNHLTHTLVASKRSTRQTNLLPFVGRDDLIRQLSAISENIRAGQGSTILIQGEGGTGKSRLLDEFASRLLTESAPWLILQGACSPFDDLLSHGPFLEALQNTMDDLNELLIEPDTSVPDARGRFFWRVLQKIRSMALSAPLMLVIDDLQWANSSTLNLFGFLSMRLHNLPIMLVGTVQHAEAIPALQRLITLGRRRRELSLFSLDPLTGDNIHDLLRLFRVNPNAVETLANWLVEKSAGNPFLLTEIIAQLRTEGILQPVGGGWQLDRMRWLRWRTTFTLPETSHDLVGWRLSNISPEARNLLDVLAVAAQPVSESTLQNIPGLWTDSFSSLVDDLVTRGLILELPEGSTLTLPHHLLRETLLHRLSNLRRRAIHQQLAESIEKGDSLNAGARQRQIAFHAVAGEDVDRARFYGMNLLSNLPREYSGSETVDFVQHLFDLLAPTASAEEMVRMTRVLGTLHGSIGHLEVAAQWHQQTLTWAQKANDYAAQAEAHFEKGELALMSNDYHTAARAAQEGLEIVNATSAEDRSLAMPLQLVTGRGYRLLGASLAMEGRDLAAAEDYLQKSVLVLRQYGNRGDLCAALFELGNVAAQRGELERALDFYGDSAHVAEAGKINYYLALACNNFAYHSLLLGRIEDAQKSVARGIKVAEDYDLIAALLHLYSTRGEIYLHKKEWGEAEESFHRGLAIAEELDSLERQAGYRGGLALVARGRNDLDEARHLLEEALAMIAERGYWHLRTRLQLWLAETLFDQVHYDEAEQILEEALEIARTQGRALLVEQGDRLRTQLLALREK